jgi:small subunit ribosomal protein S1
MADDKKQELPGPVVIRKGQVTPEASAPPRETASPPPAAAKQDNRPLWQRVADQRAGASRGPGGRGGRPQGARPGGPRGGFDRGRGDRTRGERSRHESAEQKDEARERPPRGEPPPPPPQAPLPDEGSFADMLAGSEAAPRKRYEVGEKIAGKILQIGQDVAFLELGSGIAEGMIDLAELRDDAGELTARAGDIVDGVVVKGGERGVVVSKGRAQSRMHRDREALVEAAQTGLPVEGVVKGVNKGGLEVEVLGQRAFCPVSQIDVRFVGDPSAFVGQKLQFKVQRADARDAVLSRRALLEEERAERARRTRELLAEGAVFDGTVTAVQDYGAFVDIGGIEGLVHVSELAWDRVSKPGDLLKSGDAVKVQVLRVEQDPKKGERISLSVKSLTPRPEPQATPEQPARPATAPPPPPKVGDVVKASVDKIEPFGLFVRFAGGRGLVPASETGTPRGTDLRRAFKVGDELECAISAIDEQGRLRLSKAEAEKAAERKEAQEYLRRAAPQGRGGKGFGTLGDLLRDKLKS